MKIIILKDKEISFIKCLMSDGYLLHKKSGTTIRDEYRNLSKILKKLGK